MPIGFSRIFLFAVVSIPIAVCDYRTQSVPRIPLLFLISLLLVTSFLNSTPFVSFAVSCAECAMSMAVYYLTRQLSDNRLGLADVWMAGAIGALGGFALCVNSTLVAIVLNLPCMFQIKKTTNPIPFIPAMVSGCLFFIFIDGFQGTI